MADRARGGRRSSALRRRLSSLSLRGRAFVAAGLTAVVCALAFGQDALTRAGILVLLLPLIAMLAALRTREMPQIHRVVTPTVVRAGESAQVRVALAGTRARAAALHLEEALPYALGPRPRFLLDGLERGWRRDLVYTVRPELRGAYDLGPLNVRSTDPFGLVEDDSQAGGTTPLLVTPRVLPLPPIPLAGGWQGGGEHRPQSFATGSAEDTGVREYRRGDDLRRVHWRSSARLGELMVRREEQPWEAQAVVLLDDRLLVHRGQGAASSLESAIVAAASVLAHLEQHGYTARLACSGGLATDGAARSMRHLATLAPQPRGTIETSWGSEGLRGGVVVAVLGAALDEDDAALRRLRHDAGAALALVLDVDRWAATPSTTPGGPPAVDTASMARSAGWRTTVVGPRDRLDSAWLELGRGHVHARAGSPASPGRR